MSKKSTTPSPSNTPAAQAVKTSQARSAKVKIAKRPSAPATTATAAPDAKAAAKPKKTDPTRNRSVDLINGARMGIQEYQDYTFTQQSARKLSDEQLAADWQKQFPNAVKFLPHHVGGARRDYNNGRHSKKFAKPKEPVPQYVDGKAVPLPAKVIAKATLAKAS